MPLWLAFVLGVVISWGTYVPLVHEGQSKLGNGNPGDGSLRAFLCIGIAYLITGVVIPLLLLMLNPAGIAGKESLTFQTPGGGLNWGGLGFGLLGGIAGAVGALCIVLALKSGGKPLYVVPLVFAGAPVVGTIVGLLWHPPAQKPGWLFYLGIVLAAGGAGLVLYSKPAPAKHETHAPPGAARPQETARATPAPLPSER
jgi:hypothetical protein